MIPLAVALVMLFGMAAARWYSPKWLRWTAASLLARADLLERDKRDRPIALEHYRRELGCEVEG